MISAGFAEVGEDGPNVSASCSRSAGRRGSGSIGPNCLGILNTAVAGSFNATFAPSMPPRGNVGFATQSGALGLALIDLAEDRRLGVSSFASIGNRADVTANDLLEYWEEDESTEVALLYIESFSDPRRFARVRGGPASEADRGRQEWTLGGRCARATESHTGALLSASDGRSMPSSTRWG